MMETKASNRIVLGIALVSLVFALSSCGELTVPDWVGGALIADESGSELQLSVSMSAYDVGCAGDDLLLKFSKKVANDTVTVTIKGHDKVPDSECLSLDGVQGSFDLPDLQVGESVRLELFLGESLSTYQIEREVDQVTLVTIVEDQTNWIGVGIGCSSDPDATIACVER